MSQPYIGEIRMLGCVFAPVGWAVCDGSLVDISQNDTLFNLIGTIYGGDGQNTFALPDLRSRVPVHFGTTAFGTFSQGQLAGVESVTLTTSNLPAHTHGVGYAPNGKSTDPTGNLIATTQTGNQLFLAPPGTTVNAAAASVVAAGAASPQGHSNLMPTVTLTFAISLFGIFPSQN